MELVGLTEIAEMAGVRTQVAANWSVRAPSFPQPIAKLASGKIWEKTVVQSWLIKMGYHRDYPTSQSISQTTFSIDVLYSMKELQKHFGGETMSYLPQKGSRIVCGRFDPKLNPKAPHEVIVGNFPKVVRKAEMLLLQNEAIPIFLKVRTDAWRYWGMMKAICFDRAPDQVNAAAAETTRTDPIAGILRLCEVGKTDTVTHKQNDMPEAPSPVAILEQVPPEVPIYRKTRLWFAKDVIDPLKENQKFGIEVKGTGIFVMTKADFYENFPNVIKSSSYQNKGNYHYTQIPKRAFRFLLRTNEHQGEISDSRRS